MECRDSIAMAGRESKEEREERGGVRMNEIHLRVHFTWFVGRECYY